MLNLDTITLEEARTPFEFSVGGDVWRLPHLADLPIGMQRQLDVDMFETVLPEVALVADGDEWASWPEEMFRLVMWMPAERLSAVKLGWLAHAAVEPGESPASSR